MGKIIPKMHQLCDEFHNITSEIGTERVLTSLTRGCILSMSDKYDRGGHQWLIMGENQIHSHD